MKEAEKGIIRGRGESQYEKVTYTIEDSSRKGRLRGDDRRGNLGRDTVVFHEMFNKAVDTGKGLCACMSGAQ